MNTYILNPKTKVSNNDTIRAIFYPYNKKIEFKVEISEQYKERNKVDRFTFVRMDNSEYYGNACKYLDKQGAVNYIVDMYQRCINCGEPLPTLFVNGEQVEPYIKIN